MTEKQLPTCSRQCLQGNNQCAKQSCRLWIDFEEDQNCSLISIYKNGSLTLDEIGKRMKISLVRVSQIEKQALKKLSKRIKL